MITGTFSVADSSTTNLNFYFSMRMFRVGVGVESLGIVTTSQESEWESVRRPQFELESEPRQHHHDSEILARTGIRVGVDVVQSRDSKPGVGVGVGQQPRVGFSFGVGAAVETAPPRLGNRASVPL